MTTEDFITDLFCRIDDAMNDHPKHPQAKLFPSEIVTLWMLFALKGVGNRQFFRWLKRDYFRSFHTCQSELDCFGYLPLIRVGHTLFWWLQAYSV